MIHLWYALEGSILYYLTDKHSQVWDLSTLCHHREKRNTFQKAHDLMRADGIDTDTSQRTKAGTGVRTS